MTRSVLLHRVRPAANEARFYFVQVSPSLIDSVAVLRVWGRIGGAQRSMITPCPSAEAADKLACQLVQRRLQRGYKLIQGGNEWCQNSAKTRLKNPSTNE
jgi:predicted DNA-binding WGR domain protein